MNPILLLTGGAIFILGLFDNKKPVTETIPEKPAEPAIPSSTPESVEPTAPTIKDEVTE